MTRRPVEVQMRLGLPLSTEEHTPGEPIGQACRAAAAGRQGLADLWLSAYPHQSVGPGRTLIDLYAGEVIPALA